MNVTRRDFMKGSLTQGGSLIFPFNSRLRHKSKKSNCSPAYGKSENEGNLAQRVEEAYSIFEECHLCPRQCGVNRLNGERGYCKAPSTVMIYSVHPHFGEEISLVLLAAGLVPLLAVTWITRNASRRLGKTISGKAQKTLADTPTSFWP